MLTSRQVRNRQLRDMGLPPGASYRVDVECGDEVSLLVVNQDPPGVDRVRGQVVGVIDHGWLKVVTVLPTGDGSGVVTVELFERGPADWGCVECRMVRQASPRIRPSRGRI